MREFPWLCSVIRKESGFLCNGVLEFILKPIRGCTVTYYITSSSQSSQKNVTRPLLLHRFSWMPVSQSPSLTPRAYMSHGRNVSTLIFLKGVEFACALPAVHSLIPFLLLLAAWYSPLLADWQKLIDCSFQLCPLRASGLRDSLAIPWYENPTEASK